MVSVSCPKVKPGLLLVPHVAGLPLRLLAHVVGKLAHVVSRRGILAHDVDAVGLALAAAARVPPAPERLRGLPDDLREVASVRGEAWVRPVVLCALGSPEVNEASPVGEAGAGREVLAGALYVVSTLFSMYTLCVVGW